MRLVNDTEPPPDRGRLLSADDVAAECFHGKVARALGVTQPPKKAKHVV